MIATRNAADVIPPIVPRAPYRVAAVEPLDGWRLKIRHNDGVTGLVNMAGLVHGSHAGVFAALRDEAVFRQVFLDLGAVTWPGEIDFAPTRCMMKSPATANGF